MEYTWAALIVLVGSVTLDQWILRTRLLQRREYWIYVVFISIFFFLANQYLTCRPIVLYNEEVYLGVRVGCVPIEDYIFNLSLIMWPIMIWEKAKMRKASL
ncbi:MAG: hypothetical protein KatS3mg087_1929 [Patescibacteria group bacterium]|nr:MAG: hypothetical protein KatS3mg087_1929 [Patescibacteria group bacterium]